MRGRAFEHRHTVEMQLVNLCICQKLLQPAQMSGSRSCAAFAALLVLLMGRAALSGEYDCGTYVKVGQTCDNLPKTSPGGKLRCCSSRQLTCSGDSEKAGACCLGAFNGQGEACDIAAGK